MRNHLLKNPEEILLVLDELRSDFSESSDSENYILVEDSVILKEIQQKLNKNWENAARCCLLPEITKTIRSS